VSVSVAVAGLEHRHQGLHHIEEGGDRRSPAAKLRRYQQITPQGSGLLTQEAHLLLALDVANEQGDAALALHHQHARHSVRARIGCEVRAAWVKHVEANAIPPLRAPLPPLQLQRHTCWPRQADQGEHPAGVDAFDGLT
jgi:hypothetical protein